MFRKKTQRAIKDTVDYYNPIKRPRAAMEGVYNAIVPSWRRKITKRNLKFDVSAGLSGAILLFPQAMAYAVIAGLPPIYGIYCALIPTILAAYFGSSLHLVSGPTAAISLFLYATISPLAEPGSAEYISLILMVTLLCGLIQLALGLFRMGTIVNFVSDSVIIGFTAGAGILIMASQTGSLLGIPKGDAHNLLGFIQHIINNLNQINPYALLVGVVSVFSAVVALKFAKYIKVPYLIFSLLIGSLLAFCLNHFFGGPEVTGLQPLADISSVIPPFSPPSFDWEIIQTLFPTALALALLGLTEAISIARSITLKSGQIIDSNREFAAQGVSNLAGAFFSSYASSGSFTRTGANYDAKARTPMASIISAGFVLLIGLALAPLTTYLVKPVLAGTLVVIAFKLIGFKHIKKLHKSSSNASIVMWVSMISALMIGLEFAIFAGAGLSMLFYLERVSHPRVTFARASKQANAYHFLPSRKPTDCPQLMIVFIDGSLFFGATSNLHQKITDLRELYPDRKYFLFLCSGINHMDIHGADLLKRLTLEQRNEGGDIFFYYVKSRALRVLIATGVHKIIGKKNFYNAGPGALSDIYSRIDNQTCEQCQILAYRICRRKAEEREGINAFAEANSQLNQDLDKDIDDKDSRELAIKFAPKFKKSPSN